MVIRGKVRKLAITVAIGALLSGTVLGVQSSNAASGSNCNLKSKATTANCESVTYAALQRVGSLDKLNPVGGYTESQMVYITSGLLYRFNASGVPCRDLVTEETVSSDGLTVTQKLRTIKYSDGTPFVADDAVNQFNRWVDSKLSSAYIDKVSKVVAKDDHTLVWTLKSPYPDFHFALAQEFMGIHPADRTSTKEKAAAYFKNPVSAGPMMVKTFVPGTDLFVVVANPNYWAVPVTKELRVVTMPDANTRLAAFQAKSVDYVQELPLAATSTKWDKSQYRAFTAFDSGTFMLAFNMGSGQGNPALKDARVRQAISAAVDRAQIMRVAFNNLSKPNCGMQFNHNNKYYLCSLPKNGARDLGLARSLLKAAGYAKGFKVTMEVPNRVLWQDAAQIVKDNLALVGIDVTIDMVTPDTNIGPKFITSPTRAWDMMWFGNNAATPILQLSNWFKPGGIWVANANVPDATVAASGKLLDEAASATDSDTIKAKLTAVEKIAYDISSFIPIGTRFYYSGSLIAPGLVEALMPGQLEFVVTTNPPLPTN
jgi:ABC-type transport system substrate-binding protein